MATAGADGVFIVYDANTETADPEEQRDGLAFLVPPSFPSVLFGNKVDTLQAEELSRRQAGRKDSHFLGSALSGENVDAAFEHLVRLVARRKLQDSAAADSLQPSRKTIVLNMSKRAFSADKDCCA